MKRQLGACRCIAPRSTSDALWITDDVLAAAFQRFARIHLRHQSHVPGPLEAQRRATRRKNAALAYAARPPTLDPAIFDLSKSQPEWWNNELAEDTPIPKSILPSWLLGPGHGVAAEKHTQRETAPDFEGDLTCCESPSDLRTLVRDHALNLRLATAQAEEIYEYVISKDWPATRIAEYLAEPVLHPLGCGSHLKFMRKFEEDVVRSNLETSKLLEDWAAILRGICKSVQLGLLSAQEWMQAVDSALTICGTIDGSETYRSPDGLSTMSSASVVLALLDSLKQCPVIPRDHITLAWLKSVPKRSMRSGFNPRIVKLLKVMGLKRDASLILELLLVSLERPQTTTEVLTTAEALSGLSPGTLLKVLGQTTETLTAGILSQRLELAMLSNWMQVLRTVNGEVNGERKYRVKISATDAHLITNHSGPFKDGSQRALLVLWTVHQLYDPTATSVDFDPPDCLSVVRRLLRHQGTHTVANLHNELLNAIDTLPLPDKETLIARIPALLKRRIGYDRSELEANFARFLEGDLAQITHDATYAHLKKHRQSSLTEAVERVNSDLPAFRRLIHHSITTNKVLFKVITRILRNNLAFNLALTSSWATNIAYGRRYSDLPDDILSRRYNVDPAEALDTMNFLAVTFAVSTAARSRTALKKVYWCYKALRAARAPIGAPIVRALWHAGFERFNTKGDSRGCGTVQLRWLLSKVKEVEGPDVALELVRNPEFRRARAHAIERLVHGEAQIDEIEQEDPATVMGLGAGKEAVAMAAIDGPYYGASLEPSRDAQAEDGDAGGPYDDILPVDIREMEHSAMEIVREENEERFRRHTAYEELPELGSSEEFERWLAGSVEVMENAEAREEDGLEPIWIWASEAGARGVVKTEPKSMIEPEAGLVSTVDDRRVLGAKAGRRRRKAARTLTSDPAALEPGSESVCIWDTPPPPPPAEHMRRAIGMATESAEADTGPSDSVCILPGEQVPPDTGPGEATSTLREGEEILQTQKRAALGWTWL